jgi:hypothetical protein
MAKAEKADTQAASAKTKSEKTKAEKTKSEKTRKNSAPKRKLQERVSHQLMKVGFFRRRYVKRMIKYIDKSKEKGKRLPPELYELQRFLSQVPKAQRAERLEEAITAQRTDEPLGNRDLRRASSNQTRQSGRGGNRYRPGSPPRSMQPGPRPSKRPR